MSRMSDLTVDIENLLSQGYDELAIAQSLGVGYNMVCDYVDSMYVKQKMTHYDKQNLVQENANW